MAAPNDKSNHLDVENANRGVWLVKVPKYLSNEWQKASPNSEIGRLKISKGEGGKPLIKFDVSDSVIERAVEDDPDVKVPKEHKFTVSHVERQHLAVFSHSKDDKGMKNPPKLEGCVVQKGECRPTGDGLYMNLKRHSFVNAATPSRTVMTLDKAVVAYKPISAHKADVEFEQKKKSEGKKARDDKDKVVDILMDAFSKHQYYALKDLAKISKQPVPYLKEILNEYCIYNAKNPHKNTWELKPEYRHYDNNSGDQ